MEAVYQAVLNGNQKEISDLVREKIKSGTPLNDILNDGLISAMEAVGQRFEQGVIFVPEMMLSAHVMQLGLEVLRPLIPKSTFESKGTMIIGTVKGDLHDIGKNLVIMMMEGAGFRVIDLGVDVDSETFIRSASEQEAQIVGLSALLTTTMPSMKATVEILKKKCPETKIIVGGAPITRDFAFQIGADAYGDSAVDAVKKARALLGA